MMLENCIVVKPRQPCFMIVKWNHRVEDKLLYRGVRLFAYRASSLSRAAVRMADISLTELDAWRSVLLLSRHQATRCYRQILVRSVGSGL